MRAPGWLVVSAAFLAPLAGCGRKVELSEPEREQAETRLGWSGAQSDRSRLVSDLGSRDPVTRRAATTALGLATAAEGNDETAAVATALAAAAPKLTAPPEQVALYWSLGRTGGESERQTIVQGLESSDPSVRAAAATSLGRLGRRKVPLDAAARTALGRLAGDPSAEVRKGVAYALARESAPPADDATRKALETLAADAEPETRASAILGLSQRGGDPMRYLAALDDADWRVRVQAVRALASPSGPDWARGSLSDWLVTEWTAIADLEARLLSPRVHAVLEGLDRLRPSTGEERVASAFRRLAESTDVASSAVLARYTPEVLRVVDQVSCLAWAGLVRAGEQPAKLLECGEPKGQGFPVSRRRILATVVVGDPNARIEPVAREKALRALLADKDESVRSAALAAIGTLTLPWAAQALSGAIFKGTPLEAATVAEVVASGARPALEADVPVRAAKETAVEARIALLDAIISRKLSSGQPSCTAAATDPRRAIAEKGRTCLATLGLPAPARPHATGRPVGTFPMDDAQLAQLRGRQLTLVVKTTKGTFRVALEPERAPWAVAGLVALATAKTYDGTVWHRVVPDFVVQGGDPSGTGSGGPDWQLPAEPTGGTFERGVVGIADGGLDTGGSQWFVMHSHAPHLEGRYTRAGRVTDGMEIVDSLLVGDRILEARVEGWP